jgi:hypothetical protein
VRSGAPAQLVRRPSQRSNALAALTHVTRRWNPWAAGRSASARAWGHDHRRALRTLGRPWSRILWRCWQTRTPYDPRTPHRPATAHQRTIPAPSGLRPDLAATERMAGIAVTQRAARTTERAALAGKPQTATTTDVDTGRFRGWAVPLQLRMAGAAHGAAPACAGRATRQGRHRRAPRSQCFANQLHRLVDRLCSRASGRHGRARRTPVPSRYVGALLELRTVRTVGLPEGAVVSAHADSSAPASLWKRR